MKKVSIEDGRLQIAVQGHCDGVCSDERVVVIDMGGLDVRCNASDKHDEIVALLREVEPMVSGDTKRKVSQMLGLLTAPEPDPAAIEAFITAQVAQEESRAQRRAETLARLAKCPALISGNVDEPRTADADNINGGP